MKVSEAKTKVCPFQGNMVDAFCICGDCMAWQYTLTHTIRASTNYKEGIAYENSVYEDEELIENSKEGYCKRLGQ